MLHGDSEVCWGLHGWPGRSVCIVDHWRGPDRVAGWLQQVSLSLDGDDCGRPSTGDAVALGLAIESKYVGR